MTFAIQSLRVIELPPQPNGKACMIACVWPLYKIPKYVRMAFHDVANFKADATSTGGRGCILYDFYAKMSMNRGLTPTRNELLMNLERFWLQNKVSFGWGDAVQLAGKAAIEMAFTCISIAWSFGRTVCDGREKEGGPAR